jgi:hypothetical protein
LQRQKPKLLSQAKACSALTPPVWKLGKPSDQIKTKESARNRVPHGPKVSVSPVMGT